MGRAQEQTISAGSADTALDAVLRRAASAIAPIAQRARQRFQPGQVLADGRLSIRRRIGEGGMGVVYEAEEVGRRTPVALKALSRLDPSAVYRLKNEFRSLADLHHPGVCRLYELFSEGEQWFFTMELVEGARFDLAVHPDAPEATLRACFVLLCDAVAAIHAAGKLHRDLKPSNVLVSEAGRVVVLDFGLVTERALAGAGQTLPDDGISGTPAYMAPEQAAGDLTTSASDLYSLGVMLFEALTGRLPFGGQPLELLLQKQQHDAPSVHSLAPRAPADLACLCDALLARDPTERPTLDQVRSTLAPVAGEPLSFQSAPPPSRELLLGREAELEQLRAAFDASLRGQPVVLFLSGESGMGKSALLARFVDGLRATGEATVLSGRCYEQERVPFKAFDAVVDDLTRFLRKQAPLATTQLLPRDVSALARLFPVLDRVEPIANAPRREPRDAQELQQRAFAAFAELLARMRDRRPLVISIDDWQWTCADSTACMLALLAVPEPAPLLLIASHRSEGADHNPLLQRFLSAARDNPRIDARELRLAPLSEGVARELASRLMSDGSGDAAQAIAGEAQGNPFFVGELVRQLQLAARDHAPLTLQEALLHHAGVLGDEALRLLEVLALAGRPLPVRLALDAADARDDAPDVLRTERLVRVAGDGASRRLECYHDKIRESVSAALQGDAARALHRRLAEVLSTQTTVDPEHLALHWHGAGENARAAGYYERAGDASMRALAFDFAAHQYDRARELGAFSSQQVAQLYEKRASALASAGRSRDASSAYSQAASVAAPSLALDHTRMAAHLLMTSGYVDEGRVLLGEVLGAIDLTLPRSRRAAIGSALLSRLRLTLRGLTPRAAQPALIQRAEPRLGALWTVVQGSVGNDPFLMVEMSARYAQLALDTGALNHTGRALGMEAYMVSFDGSATRARGDQLLAQAEQAADRSGDPAVIGWVKQIRGCARIHQGRFDEGRPLIDAALRWYLERCTAVPFELAGVRVYAQNAALHLGRLAEVAQTAPLEVEDALRRGDMYQATLMATGFSMPCMLAQRGATESLPQLEAAKRRHRPQSSFHWADYMVLAAELSLGLSRRDTRHGLALADAQWSALERSQLLRMHIARALMLYTRGSAAVVAARAARSAGHHERALASAMLRGLRGTKVVYAQGFADVLAAGLALLDQRPERASAALRSASNLLEAEGLRMYAASARLRLGQLLGDQGQALRRHAESAMANEGVLDFDRCADVFAPGCYA